MTNSFLNQMPTPANTLSDADTLWNLIETGMYKEQRYMKNNIYASSAFCSRYNALTLNTEVNNDSEPSLALYAQLGNCIESFVADSLIKSNRLIATQYKPKLHIDDPEIKLSGIIDVLYRNDKNQIAILEVKSIASIKSKESLYYKKDGTLGTSKKLGIVDTGPSISHKTQAEIYAALTGILDVSILYLSRNVIETFGDGIAHHIYKVDTSYANLFATVLELYYAQVCNANNVTPNRPLGFRKTIECKYCDLLNACYTTIPNGPDLPIHAEMREEAIKQTAVFMNNMQQRRDIIIADLVATDKLRLV